LGGERGRWRSLWVRVAGARCVYASLTLAVCTRRWRSLRVWSLMRLWVRSLRSL